MELFIVWVTFAPVKLQIHSGTSTTTYSGDAFIYLKDLNRNQQKPTVATCSNGLESLYTVKTYTNMNVHTHSIGILFIQQGINVSTPLRIELLRFQRRNLRCFGAES